MRIDCLKQGRFNILLLRLLEFLGNKESSFSPTATASCGLIGVVFIYALLTGILGVAWV